MDVRFSRALLFAVLFLSFSGTLHGQFIKERQFLSSPDPSDSVIIHNYFGYSITMNDNYLVVSDHRNMFDLNGGNQMQWAGAVYSYKLDTDTLWRFEQKIISNNRFNNEDFGRSVDSYGHVLVVGANGSTLDTNNTNFLLDAGAAYVYSLDSAGIWNWDQKLIPSNRNMDDGFGLSLSLYGDILAVGSPGNDYDSNNVFLNSAGSVFMFKKDSIGKFRESQHLTASDRTVDMLFGRNVLLINEDELMVGAPFEGQNAEGAVYYFVKNSAGEWEEKQKIVAWSREVNANFGDKGSVAVVDNTLVIGAFHDKLDNQGQNPKMSCGAIYIFNRNINGLWQQSKRMTAPFREWNMRFGSSVALNDKVLMVGAPLADTDENNQDSILYAGAAYAYLKNAVGDFVFFQKLVYENRKKEDQFGGEVCLKGNVLIIGNTSINDKGFTLFYTLKDSTVGFTEYIPRLEGFDAAIYPNPTSGNFTLYSTGVQLDRMLVYDINSRLVFKENLNGKESSEVYLPDNILNGLYLVRIESGREVVNKKLIVNGR